MFTDSPSAFFLFFCLRLHVQTAKSAPLLSPTKVPRKYGPKSLNSLGRLREESRAKSIDFVTKMLLRSDHGEKTGGVPLAGG